MNKGLGLSEVDIRRRLDNISTMTDLYVVLTRTNPDICSNCEQRWPAYRYRRLFHDIWRIGRTYCACGYAQWPNLRRWNLLDRLESELNWARFCLKRGRWVSRKDWFAYRVTS